MEPAQDLHEAPPVEPVVPGDPADPKAPPGAPPEPEPEPEVDAVALKRRARLGVIALVARTIVLQFVVLGGNVWLARLLAPEDWGAFAIIQFSLAFFAFFGDAGLGGALVQKKEEPTQRDLSSVWCFQIIVSLAVVVIVFVGAPFIVRFWPDMPSSSTWLMRALSIELLLTAARVIPAILMERHLQFGRLALLDVFLTVAFYVTTVALALMHFGVIALVGGVVVQGVVGVIVAFVMRPWRPTIVIDRARLKPILKFGMSYQAKNLIGFVNGASAPVYAGAMLGPAQLGYINWAQTTAFFPLKLVEVMARVSFPLFSRLQGDRVHFAESLGRSIQLCAVGTLFCVGLFFGLGPQIIHVIFTDKWMPALPLFYIYTGAISIGFLSPLVGAALDATGRPQIFVRLAIGWTLLNWAVVLIATPIWHTMGFAAGYAVHVVVGNLAVVLVVRKLIPESRIWPRVRASLFAGALVFALARWGIAPWVSGGVTLATGVVLAVLAFAGAVVLLDRSALADAMSIIPRKKQPA